MKKRPEPCLWCGGATKVEDVIGIAHVRCVKPTCAATGPLRISRAAATDTWNTVAITLRELLAGGRPMRRPAPEGRANDE